MSLIYYSLDALLDYLILYENLSFLDTLVLNVPVNELYNRFTAILLIIVSLLLIRLNSLRIGRTRRIREDDIFTDLNKSSVIELVGHQLKTSLSTIIGFSKLMDEKGINEKTRSMYSEHVYISSTNLLHLFNNLIDLNRLINDRYTILKETCKVTKMLGDLRDKYKEDIDNRPTQKISLKMSVPEASRNLTLVTDCIKMQKILGRLLENAINFTHEGIIEFGYTIEDNTVRFFVTDKGGGLSLENLENAFSHYSIRKKSLDAIFDLAALRVIVARKLAELIGGNLWSDSKLGMGSTFYFSTPLSGHHEELQTEKLEDGGVPDWGGKMVLVAEDVEPNYLLLKELLKPTKVEMTWARNGREAVEYFREHQESVDLILMDIVMPEMDGFEAARKIRELSQQVPIVGQTAYSLEYDNNPDQLVNFNDYITKPIWYHELISRMIKYI